MVLLEWLKLQLGMRKDFPSGLLPQEMENPCIL